MFNIKPLHDKIVIIVMFEDFQIKDRYKFVVFDFNKKYGSSIGMDLHKTEAKEKVEKITNYNINKHPN